MNWRITMLKVLAAVRLTALRVWFTGGGNSKKKQSTASMIGFAILMLYSLAAFGFLFWHIFDTFAAPFTALGLDWLYFALSGLSGFGLMFLGSVFFTKAQLYDARDNDLLLSMPLTPADIVLSRMLMLLVLSVVFGMPVFVSALITALSYGMLSGVKLAIFLAVWAALPFFSMGLSAVFGWLLTKLLERVRCKALIATVLCVALIIVYSIVMARLNTAITGIAAAAGGLAQQLGAFQPVFWLGNCIASESAAQLAACLAIAAAVFAVAYILIIRTFISTASTQRGFAKKQYTEKLPRERSIDNALLGREFARLTSSSAYMVNAGLGVLMMPIGAAALIIKRAEVTQLLTQQWLLPILFPALTAMICLLCSMNFVSAPSVSLEGSNLWIARSLPVPTRKILAAKLKLHLYVSLPPLALLLISCFAVLRPDAANAAAAVLLSFGMTFFTGVLGLAENLRHPNFDWINEAQAVKSGVGVLFTMLISMGTVAIPVLIYLVFGDKVDYLVIAYASAAVIIAAGALMLYRLMTHGTEIFEGL